MNLGMNMKTLIHKYFEPVMNAISGFPLFFALDKFN